MLNAPQLRRRKVDARVTNALVTLAMSTSPNTVLFATAQRWLLCLAPFFLTMSYSASIDVLIGTYTRDGKSRGIYSFKLDTEKGICTQPKVAAEASNPNFLALHRDGKTVYAVADFLPAGKTPTGAVVSYRFDSATSTLKQFGMQATGPVGAPCHIALDPASRGAVVVNYSGGYVASLGISSEGALSAASELVHHTGQLGPHKKRQEKPHPHSSIFSPDGRFSLVCDLGLDRISVYPWNSETGKLSVEKVQHFPTPAGAGPRHARFSADGRFFYVLNELDGTICTFAWKAEAGALALLGTTATIPADYAGPTNTAAEIRLHPNGRFLYATNRGHDSIAVLAVEPSNGSLRFIERVSAGGKHPRHFNVTPDGKWLLCANRDTDNIVVYKIDSETGRLQPNGQTITVAQPICVLFVP